MNGPPQTVVRHDIGINIPEGLRCDCGQPCDDLTAWHAHTALTYNDPSDSAIQLRGGTIHTSILTVAPEQTALISNCTKVACAAAGNNIECWTLTMDGYPVLYGLHSRQLAEDLAVHGGVFCTTYTFATC